MRCHMNRSLYDRDRYLPVGNPTQVQPTIPRQTTTCGILTCPRPQGNHINPSSLFPHSHIKYSHHHLHISQKHDYINVYERVVIDSCSKYLILHREMESSSKEGLILSILVTRC